MEARIAALEAKVAAQERQIAELLKVIKPKIVPPPYNFADDEPPLYRWGTK